MFEIFASTTRALTFQFSCYLPAIKIKCHQLLILTINLLSSFSVSLLSSSERNLDRTWVLREPVLLVTEKVFASNCHLQVPCQPLFNWIVIQTRHQHHNRPQDQRPCFLRVDSNHFRMNSYNPWRKDGSDINRFLMIKDTLESCLEDYRKACKWSLDMLHTKHAFNRHFMPSQDHLFKFWSKVHVITK